MVYFPENDVTWKDGTHLTDGVRVFFPQPRSLVVHRSRALRWEGRRDVPVTLGYDTTFGSRNGVRNGVRNGGSKWFA